MNGDDAIVLLAAAAKMLPLNAGSLHSLLVVTRFINDADGMFVSVFVANNLLQPLPHEIFLPFILAEKLLQSSHGYTLC